jgi:hypothetical protein
MEGGRLRESLVAGQTSGATDPFCRLFTRSPQRESGGQAETLYHVAVMATPFPSSLEAGIKG